MANSELVWHKARVEKIIAKATDSILWALALEGETLAKLQVTANDQIDTGFMRGSIYAVGPGGGKSDYRKIERTLRPSAGVADEQKPPKKTSAFVCAAEYAMDQEQVNSFMYRALGTLQGRADRIIVAHKITG